MEQSEQPQLSFCQFKDLLSLPHLNPPDSPSILVIQVQFAAVNKLISKCCGKIQGVRGRTCKLHTESGITPQDHQSLLQQPKHDKSTLYITDLRKHQHSGLDTIQSKSNSGIHFPNMPFTMTCLQLYHPWKYHCKGGSPTLSEGKLRAITLDLPSNACNL